MTASMLESPKKTRVVNVVRRSRPSTSGAAAIRQDAAGCNRCSECLVLPTASRIDSMRSVGAATIPATFRRSGCQLTMSIDIWSIRVALLRNDSRSRTLGDAFAASGGNGACCKIALVRWQGSHDRQRGLVARTQQGKQFVERSIQIITNNFNTVTLVPHRAEYGSCDATTVKLLPSEQDSDHVGI